VIVVQLFQKLEEFAFVFFTVVVSLGRHTCHVLESVIALSAFNSLKRAVELGPSLLKKHSPDLTRLRGTKSSLITSVVYREPVIHDNWSNFTIDEQRD